MMVKGVQKIFQAGGAARCDVTVDSGPTYASRRAEAADKLLQLLPAIPAIGMRAPDLVVLALDLPDGDQIAARVRPPDVQADNENGQPDPQQLMGVLQQQHQAMVAQAAQIQALTELLKNKILDLESKERIATQTNIARIEAAALTGKSAIASQVAQQTHEHIQGELDRRADLLNTGMTLEHEAQQAELERQQQAQQQAQSPQQPAPPAANPALPSGAGAPQPAPPVTAS
jgi:hypothetical protein